MNKITKFMTNGRFDGFETDKAPQKHILIACMPKSGSTFLSDIISQLPGFNRAVLVPSAGRREQELDEGRLQQVDALNYVGQHHVRYSEWTAQMCRDYGLKPVVLVRGLLDVVVSLRDHMRNESPAFSMLFADRAHADMDDAELEQMIARLAAPWFVNFYMSWRQAPDALMVTYEELIRAPAKVVSEILAFSGVEAMAVEIETAVRRVHGLGESRLNVGVAGRGAALKPETVRGLLDLLDYYPEAAADPYIQAVKAQGAAALSLTHSEISTPSFSGAPMPKRPLPAVWTPAKHWRRWLVRRFAPFALLAFALGYWLLPNDLIPDGARWGRLDDGLVVAILGVYAGRLTKYKPKFSRGGSGATALRLWINNAMPSHRPAMARIIPITDADYLASPLKRRAKS